MPIYDFSCEKCNKVFEVIVPLVDCLKPLKCKYCDEEMKKIIKPCFFKVVYDGKKS